MTKRGRPKSSDLSRAEQLREARKRYREKKAKEGLSQISIYISEKHKTLIDEQDGDASEIIAKALDHCYLTK